MTDWETGVSAAVVHEALRGRVGEGGAHVEVCEGLLSVDLHPVD